ncbi:hypothetical protein BUALT_Bualt07G0139500 [Buddleja alternifolia]|uniref:RanBD1 domain-containing protein n=1 Tax=Buddleja alternifolia TaxID=168488 RepID=A0AAV6XLI7_9LAMI|nr:hypothetical protein BUALT_Bualt07G0139500 [Buddleja alternifolia]
MGDAEIQPSKKRAAGVQLSRDNPGLDDNEDSSELEAGTFKRASDEVLASRRIVKVRRQQTSSTTEAPPSTASNPFAAIRLVPPAPPMDKVTEQIDTKAGEAENEVDELKGEYTAEEKTDIADDNAKQSESKVDESKAEPNFQKDETDDVTKQNIPKSVVDEVAEGENTGSGAKKDTEADTSVEGEENNEKNPETASFSSFQQLSSSQNAFSGLTGTGFSATSFSFGTIPKDGSPVGSTSTPLFGFGASNNGNSSIFGTSATNTVSQTEGSKFPPMQEVSVETGEENEKAVFSADSILFEYIDGAWKERGKGELKLNVSTTGTAKARLIMRARGNYRLILNASLFPDMKLTNMDKKGITFACMNSAGEGKDGLSTIALKFKDPSIVEEFKAAVAEHKDKTPVAVKTPENSPKASDE